MNWLVELLFGKKVVDPNYENRLARASLESNIANDPKYQELHNYSIKLSNAIKQLESDAENKRILAAQHKHANRDIALKLLKERNNLLKQIEGFRNKKENVDAAKESMKKNATNAEYTTVMTGAKVVLDKQTKNFNIDDILDLQTDLQEKIDESNEVNETVNSALGSNQLTVDKDIEEEELMRELEQLDSPVINKSPPQQVYNQPPTIHNNDIPVYNQPPKIHNNDIPVYNQPPTIHNNNIPIYNQLPINYNHRPYIPVQNMPQQYTHNTNNNMKQPQIQNNAKNKTAEFAF